MKVDLYERVWMYGVVLMLVAFFTATAVAAVRGSIHPPSHVETIDPRSVLTQPPFVRQGITKDGQGKLHVTRVRTGITDGKSTVVESREIKEGMQVIAGVTEASEDAGNSNPFQQPQEDGPGRFRRTGGF